MTRGGLRRVVVTGLGAVTPLGLGIKRTWQRLIDGQCGVVSTRPLGNDFKALPSQVAGLVSIGPASKGGWTASEHVSSTEIRQASKFAQYGLTAAAEALSDAGFPNGDGIVSETTGVCLGSGIGALEDLYDTSLAYGSASPPNYRKMHPLFVPRLLINLGAGHISMRYNLQGPNHTATTACTTGAHSIGDAMRFVAHGDADMMLAGGAESCIHPLAIGGFARSRSLATDFNENPEKSSRPFDRARAGFVIGEGAAVLVLEEFEHAKQRNARIYAEIVGYGCSADAHHLTAPREDGDGALRAMRLALRQAQIKPDKVNYINAHATSTPLGDAAENAAIGTLVCKDGDIRSPAQINVSSTKGAIGHLLGAAGAIEALFTVLAIKEDTMPPTLNLEHPSEGFRCNYAANQAQQRRINVALTNSFGFGGTNASLCFRQL